MLRTVGLAVLMALVTASMLTRWIVHLYSYWLTVALLAGWATDAAALATLFWFSLFTLIDPIFYFFAHRMDYSTQPDRKKLTRRVVTTEGLYALSVAVICGYHLANDIRPGKNTGFAFLTIGLIYLSYSMIEGIRAASKGEIESKPE